MSLISGTSGPFGPFSKLVVRIVGSLKYLALAAMASTLFLNSPGEKSCTNEIRPDWWSTSRHAASFLDRRVYLNEFVIPYTSCARSVRVGPDLFRALTRQMDGVNSTHQVEKRFTAKVAETELRAEAESRGDYPTTMRPHSGCSLRWPLSSYNP